MSPTFPPSSFSSWFTRGQNANWGMQLQGTGTRCVANLDLSVSPAWSEVLSKASYLTQSPYSASHAHPRLPGEAPHPGNGAWMSDVDNTEQLTQN